MALWSLAEPGVRLCLFVPACMSEIERVVDTAKTGHLHSICFDPTKRHFTESRRHDVAFPHRKAPAGFTQVASQYFHAISLEVTVGHGHKIIGKRNRAVQQQPLTNLGVSAPALYRWGPASAHAWRTIFPFSEATPL